MTIINVLLLGGCGGGGSGTTGTGGEAATASSSASSMGGAGGGSSSDSSTDSSSASSGDASSSSGAGGADPCLAGPPHFEGTLDGKDFSQEFAFGGATQNVPPVDLVFGTRGFMRLQGSAGSVQGPFVMPKEGPSPGVWFYAGAGSTAQKIGSRRHVSLTSIAKLGKCPAASGSGSLTFCFDTNKSCPGGKLTTTDGDVGGTMFDWGGTANYKEFGASLTTVEIVWQSGAFFYALHTGDNKSGAISKGILWMPSVGPDAGAFYCVGAGGFDNSLNITNLQVGGLTRMGTPAEVPATVGTVTGCY